VRARPDRCIREAHPTNAPTRLQRPQQRAHALQPPVSRGLLRHTGCLGLLLVLLGVAWRRPTICQASSLGPLFALGPLCVDGSSAAIAAANGQDGKGAEEIRAAMGDKFPKHIYHSIICIGALVAHRELGAPHVGDRPKRALISSFVDRIAELSPQLVTFNGSSFDLPVLRYRALVHGVAAPGLSARPYFNRYTEDAVDLCDVLSSYNSQGKVTLHELCRVMGLPGKPDGISGADVDRYYREGRIREIAEYCESDVVNTYRVWLRYELFRGRISAGEFEASEAALVDFMKARGNTKPHLADLI
jgi:3'-5' exonuclease